MYTRTHLCIHKEEEVLWLLTCKTAGTDVAQMKPGDRFRDNAKRKKEGTGDETVLYFIVMWITASVRWNKIVVGAELKCVIPLSLHLSLFVSPRSWYASCLIPVEHPSLSMSQSHRQSQGGSFQNNVFISKSPLISIIHIIYSYYI